jgi:hypothetical protein
MCFLLEIPKQIYLFIRALITAFAAAIYLGVKTWPGRIILGLSIISIVGAVAYRFLYPPLPSSVQVFDLMWLKQGWTEDQRQTYYHTSQGTLVIPYSWYFALEQPPIIKWPIVLLDDRQPFNADDNVTRYRVIPSPRPQGNPDRLPVGIAKAVLPPEYVDQLGQGQKEWLSYSCAFCHTTQMNYKGLGIRIDGGPGNLDFTTFTTALANMLILTDAIPSKFDRFAEKVLQREGRPLVPSEKDKLKSQLQSFLKSSAIKAGVLSVVNRTYPTKEGFGRMDALGRGVNGQFGQLDSRNVQQSTAPISIPQLWNSHDYGWVQSIAAIRQPMGRNVTEAWGVNAAVDLTNTDSQKRAGGDLTSSDPQMLYASSVNMKNMFWMETLVSLLTPPEWPGGIFGPVDMAAAKRGQYLYEEGIFDNALDPAAEELWPNPNRTKKGLCARCHALVKEVQPNENGQYYYDLPVYRLDVIATDPNDATSFAARKIYTGNLKDVLFNSQEQVGVGEAFTKVSTQIMDREYREMHIGAEERKVWDGFRENLFRAPLGYPARPIQGIWATPPYLHNGSVANFYDLLSPVSERAPSFWTGNIEYDPVVLGFSTKSLTGGFEFKVRDSVPGALWNAFAGLFVDGTFKYTRNIAGNSNTGHEFRDAPKGTPGVIGPTLSPQQRRDIIEYVKVIRDVPDLPPEEKERRKKLLDQMKAEYEDKQPK